MISAGANRDSLEPDEKLVVKCVSRDGRPAASLSWFLDDEPITEGLSVPEFVESLARDNQTLYSTSQELTRYIRTSDDRKQLTCQASHIAATRPQVAHKQLYVRCEYSLLYFLVPTSIDTYFKGIS